MPEDIMDVASSQAASYVLHCIVFESNLMLVERKSVLFQTHQRGSKAKKHERPPPKAKKYQGPDLKQKSIKGPDLKPKASRAPLSKAKKHHRP